jgi:hypothetical protein
VEVEPLERPPGPGPLHTLLPEAVVAGPPLRILQDLVGLGDLLEPLLRLPGAVVPVRVVFHGELAVGLLDLALVRVPGNPQDLVVIRHQLPFYGVLRRPPHSAGVDRPPGPPGIHFRIRFTSEEV